jgi:alkanesulfonate monooxygenase SsuD/methylene tetrahydromethanopterin reductase-like flavin-dependent oxidoreductase (luciferase family)
MARHHWISQPSHGAVSCVRKVRCQRLKLPPSRPAEQRAMTHARQMKLGLSIGSSGYHNAAWRLPEASPDGGLSARHYIQGAQLAERGKFDFVFIADIMAIRNFDDRRIAREREHAILKLEPTLALAAVAATTERVGLIPSVSTTYNPPYAFARRMASLDHISGGRAGWNMVTSWSVDEARNFSLDAPLDSNTPHTCR